MITARITRDTAVMSAAQLWNKTLPATETIFCQETFYFFICVQKYLKQLSDHYLQTGDNWYKTCLLTEYINVQPAESCSDY